MQGSSDTEANVGSKQSKPSSTAKSFASNAVMYGIGGLLLEAASVILLPLYLNYLRPEDFGTLEVLNRLGTFVVIGLMANGLRMATYTFYLQAEDQYKRQRIAATATLVLFILVLFGAGATFLVTPKLRAWLHLSNERLLAVGMITVLLESGVIIPLALMQARIEAGRFVWVTLVLFLARVALIAYFVCGLRLGLWGVLSARAIVSIVFGVVLNVAELRRSSFQVDWCAFKAMVFFALPFLPGGLFAFFINNGDRFYLLRQAGEHEVGIYALSYRLAGVTTLIAFSPLYKVWSAKMYAVATQDDAPRIFGLTFTRIMVCLMAPALLISLVSKDILRVIGADDYLEATQYVHYLLAAIVFMSAADLMDSAFFIKRTTKFKPLIYALTGLVIFVAYSTLIPTHGAYGAAWATLLAFVIHAIVTWVVTQYVFYVHYEWVRLSITAAAAWSCWYASSFLSDSYLGAFYKLGLFIVWLMIVGLLSDVEERRAVTGLGRELYLHCLRGGRKSRFDVKG